MADEQEHSGQENSGNNPKKSMNPASEEGSGQSSGGEPTEHLELQVDPGKCEAPKFSEDKDPIIGGIGIRGGHGGNIFGPIGPRRNTIGGTVTQTRGTGIQGGEGGDGPRRNMFTLFPKSPLDYMHSQQTSKCFVDKSSKALGQVHISSTSKNAGESISIKEEGCKQENRELNIHDTDTQGEESRDIVPGQGTEKDSITRPASGDGGDNSSRGSIENDVLQATAYLENFPSLEAGQAHVQARRKRDGQLKAVKTSKKIKDAPAPAPAPDPAPAPAPAPAPSAPAPSAPAPTQGEEEASEKAAAKGREEGEQGDDDGGGLDHGV